MGPDRLAVNRMRHSAAASGAGPEAPVDALECRELRLAYGDAPVLDAVNLAVAPGETLALLGPSGSGKTSLLYAVAGFLEPAGGEIRIRGELVAGGRTSVPPERRRVGVVFQHYALWPHLSALETVAYPLRRNGVGRDEARHRAGELLALMGIGHLAARRPAALSGGEQQRVGVARALARGADLLLLDEPTAHLDVPLRAALVAELAEQRRRTGAAAVYATHDVAEALAIADRVALLRDGGLVQVGTPRQVYECPVDLAAARLSGAASVLDAELLAVEGSTATLRLDGRTVPVRLADGDPSPASRRPGAVRLLVRPDWIVLEGDLPATVTAAWFRGAHTDYRLETPSGETLELRRPGPPVAGPGDAVRWGMERAWLLP